MKIAQIEENLQNLVENFSEEEFIFELLLAYGVPKTTVTLLKKGNRNLGKKDGQLILKKKVFFEVVKDADLHARIDEISKDEVSLKHDPKFIIVTDFKTLLAINTKTKNSLDIPILEINKHPDFFGELAGLSTYTAPKETEADVKAAEKMAKLYDEILKDNPFKTKEELHSLNVFLSRLLFCFFAEDTEIFTKGSFTNSIASNTQPDGSDLDDYLNRVFKVMNTEHRTNEPKFIKDFPYVNGGLFGQEYFAPKFTAKSRKMIIDCGALDWAAINPDIFGSMIQAVVHPDQRGGMGMHYTSVPNIMKVIEPLFMNELKEEFGKNFENKAKLEVLLQRLEKIKIFDPACGSGNFLIIAYKELRTLEMEILKRINELSKSPEFLFSRIKLSQFYGIELDDFAHEVAILSLWLAEHQMNVKFKEVFGKAKPPLPLKEAGNIIRENAARVNWEDVCPKSNFGETYILGNPPYQGARRQSELQKSDMDIVLKSLGKYKDLDYISCWFFKAANYIRNHDSEFAFVTTNSICQGQQVSLLWPAIFNLGLEIQFAHQSFKWENNAKSNAGVTCVIIGISNPKKGQKTIYNEGFERKLKSINPYLAGETMTIISQSKKAISKLPKMNFGNMPNDGGGLILSPEDRQKLLAENPKSQKFVRLLLGSQEYIRGEKRYCLWIKDKDLTEAKNIPFIQKRIKLTEKHRLESKDLGTNKLAFRSHQFRDTNEAQAHSIIIPRVSSERREYIPMGFLDRDPIISDSALAVYDAEPWVFGVITSKLHMVWVKAVGGKLKTDYRYSAELCYNTFPVPNLTSKQKDTISQHVFNVLEEREKHSQKTLAELYDPDKMPDGLREAHHNLDIAVERCYRSRPFTSDEERLEYLFKLYEAMISGQDIQGDLLL